MPYCLSNEVRLYTGLTTFDISNDDLDQFINIASSIMIEDLTISVVEEEISSGAIDGNNSTFELSKFPIADISGNKTVGSEDIVVYGYTIRDDPSTKSTIEVSTVYSREGIFVTSSAPSASIEQITVDYSYTLDDNSPNWELVKVACSYLTAYLFSIRKFTVIPDSLNRGPLRYSYKTKPYNEYYKKYEELMSKIKTQLHIKKQSRDMKLKRKRM